MRITQIKFPPAMGDGGKTVKLSEPITCKQLRVLRDGFMLGYTLGGKYPA